MRISKFSTGNQTYVYKLRGLQFPPFFHFFVYGFVCCRLRTRELDLMAAGEIDVIYSTWTTSGRKNSKIYHISLLFIVFNFLSSIKDSTEYEESYFARCKLRSHIFLFSQFHPLGGVFAKNYMRKCLGGFYIGDNTSLTNGCRGLHSRRWQLHYEKYQRKI